MESGAIPRSDAVTSAHAKPSLSALKAQGRAAKDDHNISGQPAANCRQQLKMNDEPTTETTGQSPRLNPFAFPSETNQRFILFAIAAVMWVLNWARLTGELLMELISTGDMAIDYRVWQAALPSAVILAAIGLYLVHPTRIVRQQKLEPFDPAQDAKLQSEVELMGTVAGIAKQPHVMIRGVPRVDGQAFGLPGNYVIRLDQGLRLLVRKAPALFRARYLHELAHIANRDIGRSYFSHALWSATLWLAIIPYLAMAIITLIGSRLGVIVDTGTLNADFYRLLTVSLPTVLFLAAQFGTGVLIAYSIRASLLRSREYAADWRVALWGAAEPLAGILGRSAAGSSTAPSGRRERLTRWVRLHPSPQDRLHALQNPDQQFQLRLEIPFFVGWLTTTIALGALEIYPQWVVALGRVPGITMLFVERMMANTSGVLYWLLGVMGWLIFAIAVLLVFSPLIAFCMMVMGTLGLQVLREATADLYFGRVGSAGYVRLLLPALLVVLGMNLGAMTIPDGWLLLGPTVTPRVLVQAPAAALLVWVCLLGLRLFGGRILGTQTGCKPPVLRRRMLLLAFGLFFALFVLLFIGTQWLAIASEENGVLGNTANAEDARFLLTLLSAGSKAVLVIYIASFAIGWAVTRVWRRFWPPRCPLCNRIAKQRHVLGQRCDSCGAELAPWLLTQ